jgi:hypothetical protein
MKARRSRKLVVHIIVVGVVKNALALYKQNLKLATLFRGNFY